MFLYFKNQNEKKNNQLKCLLILHLGYSDDLLITQTIY